MPAGSADGNERECSEQSLVISFESYLIFFPLILQSDYGTGVG